MRSILFYTLALHIMFGYTHCKPKVEEPLSEEKFIDVFTRIHMAEGNLRSKGIYGDSARRIAPFVYAAVFKEAGVDSADFYDMYALYAANPERMSSALEQVQIRMTELEGN
jgi:Domain of unknown function (DUF4296)